MTERTRWLFLLFLAPLFWAGNALIGRVVVADHHPLVLAFWRWLTVFVILMPLAGRSLWRARALIRAHWLVLLIMSVFSVTAYNTLLYMAVHTTSAVNATLVGTTMPVMMLILARLWLGEAIHARQGVGIVLSFAGLVLLVGRGDPARLAGLQFTPGDLYMLLATLAWAIYSVMLRRFPTGLTGLTQLAVQVALGLLVLTPIAWGVTGGAGMEMPTGSFALAVAYTALFASILAYLVWNQGVKVLGAGVAGQYSYCIPLFTALLGVPLIGEEIAWYHLVGGGAIIAGIVVATLRR